MQRHRRLWVRRGRAARVVLQPLPWRESMKSLADAGLENWPQLLTIALGILAYFTLLHR